MELVHDIVRQAINEGINNGITAYTIKLENDVKNHVDSQDDYIDLFEWQILEPYLPYIITEDGDVVVSDDVLEELSRDGPFKVNVNANYMSKLKPRGLPGEEFNELRKTAQGSLTRDTNIDVLNTDKINRLRKLINNPNLPEASKAELREEMRKTQIKHAEALLKDKNLTSSQAQSLHNKISNLNDNKPSGGLYDTVSQHLTGTNAAIAGGVALGGAAIIYRKKLKELALKYLTRSKMIDQKIKKYEDQQNAYHAKHGQPSPQINKYLAALESRKQKLISQQKYEENNLKQKTRK